MHSSLIYHGRCVELLIHHPSHFLPSASAPAALPAAASTSMKRALSFFLSRLRGHSRDETQASVGIVRRCVSPTISRCRSWDHCDIVRRLPLDRLLRDASEIGLR